VIIRGNRRRRQSYRRASTASPDLDGRRPDIRAAARQRLRGTLYQPHGTIMRRERANGL
jgi:hypothetical protein